MSDTAFVAYPVQPSMVGDSIDAAVELIGNDARLRLRPWKKMATIGLKLDDLIRFEIEEADVLAADITYPNFNVFYEIGYAIARGKPIIPLVNTAVERSVERIQGLGLFDTIGWITYNNGRDIADALSNWRNNAWLNKYIKQRDFSQPLYILDTLKKVEFRNQIFRAAEDSSAKFRRFDPGDNPRLTATQAISDIAASAGAILPLLAEDIVDATNNNLRVSFLAGLCHGFGIEPLIIQYGHGPAPLDFRDYITNSTFRYETEKHVSEYCNITLVKNQERTSGNRDSHVGILDRISVGSPQAENETEHLKDYFVRTAEYTRTIRAESAVVIGRKGSGKTAISFRAADEFGKDSRTCVVELRPSSHNLSELREAILDVSSSGVFDHTIAAFWHYMIYVEVALRIREKLLPRSKRDVDLQDRIRKLEDDLKLDDATVSGDFTSRLENAVEELVSSLREKEGITPADLTNTMYEEHLPKIRDHVAGFHDAFDTIYVLTDDLDKGWPPRRVEGHDASMIRHLIESLGRMRRELKRKKIDFRHFVFLRSDIYEKLVEVTSDRGKYNAIRVDWSDREQIMHMLRERVTSSFSESEKQFAWDALNPLLPSGRPAMDTMIESSLRRPRFLIDLCERAVSVAINRGHNFVTDNDVEEGLRQMSLYLVSDFGYEIRDIAGTPDNIFYSFLGLSELLTHQEIDDALTARYPDIDIDGTVELLLWYGFLGVIGADGSPIYIYDREYDYRRLDAERVSPDETLYSVNPAFLRGLQRDASALAH